MRIFLNSADTIYCFPTALNPNFKFFLKSKNLNELEISPNSHSTEALTELIAALNASISAVNTGTSPIR